MPAILIVEDEPAIVASLEEDLRRQGYETEVAADGEQGIRRGQARPWDLILLDVMLPKIDGFDVCAALRRSGVTAPIILLTARAQEAEKILGLDSGADDYVTKPFSLRELRARIRAQLRRGERDAERIVRFGECEVDLNRAEVRRGGQKVELTAQEFRVLEVFIRNAGRILSRDQLIDAAWGPGMAITDRVVDKHVFNLRRKIEAVPAEPRHLLGVRGLGYRFERDS
jgi:DNA-binding response OmpR family regulator